jgi:sugar lactone lactonase YvrE
MVITAFLIRSAYPLMRIPAALFACVLAVASAPGFAQSYTFTLFAGAPPPTGSRDGVGSDARFNTPIGVALDSAGNMYVADRSNAIIRKITPAGVVTTIAGTAGAIGTVDGTGSAARFNEPNGIAVDSAGNLFVTDRAEHTIRKITQAGVVTTFAGLASTPGSVDATGSAARFRSPYGIAVDGDANLYISDSGNRTIRKISAAGVVSTIAGLSGFGGNTDGAGSNARFNALSGLTIDGSGNLYVADSGSHLIRKISPAGVVSTLAGQAGVRGSTNGVGSAARFNAPLAIAAEGGGTVYVADTVNESIRRITPDGTVTTFAGSAIAGSLNGTGASARFFRPQGIAVDGGGNVFVSDTYNHTIRKITPAAVTSAVAGPGGNFGSADGTGANALLNRPRGIGLDSQGNAYVADSFNNTVRKITPSGNVTTFAGQAGATAYVDAVGTAARFVFPSGLAVDSADNIFVSDTSFNAVRRISPTGTVLTWGGTPSTTTGAADGPIGTGRMNFPQGVAVDSQGTVYVADSLNHIIRKLSPTSVLSTLAGLAGVAGSSDGNGVAARFSSPGELALDSAGNVYVTDYDNCTIRKITPAGTVTTLAGLANAIGFVDGTGSEARFQNPDGITVDGAGNVFVSDSNNQSIRKITPSGVVTTIGGQAGAGGVAEGTGTAARFFIPSGLAIDRDGALYVVSAYGNVVMKGVLDVTPKVVTHPQSQRVLAGTGVTLSVLATGGGLNYQWKFNDAPIPGANGATYAVNNIGQGAAGNYTVQVSNSAGSITSNAATITIIEPTTDVGRITNLAIRSQAGTGAQTLIVGVAIGGNGTAGTKPVLLRGVGPTLSQFGVTGLLADPKLELFSGSGTKINENDDWSGNAQITTIGGQVGAFALNGSTSKDAALYNSTFSPGSYSVWITGTAGATGVALAEIYDATAANAYTATTPRLTNVSARTQVGTGGDILIAGFVIGGQTSKTVLIRAVGPTLGAFGVPGVLANPKLELFTGSTKINENDNWGGAPALSEAFLSVAAFPLPAASADAVLLVTLAPGSYTAQVSGVDGTTGVALVEVYEIP